MNEPNSSKGGQKVFFSSTTPPLATQNFLASDPPHLNRYFTVNPQAFFIFNWF
jgi:hypothetical protein